MAGRRGNNEGLIRKRTDGRWEGRVSLDGGKQKSFYGKTRAEVAKRLTALLRERDQGLPVVDGQQTLNEFCDTWLTIAKPAIKQSTWERYEQLLRVHLRPTLGKVKLAKLTPTQLQTLYAQRIEAGSSPSTVNHLHAVTHLTLDAAVRLGSVPRNVADFVTPPRMKRTEMHVLTSEQARTLLTAAEGDELEALYVLALTTGLREGELLGLRWRDVDLQQQSLQVRSTVRRTRTGFALTEPKSARSRRKVALTRLAADALKRHRVCQAENHLQAGANWKDHDLVFPNSVGNPIEAGNLLRRSFWPLLTKAGLVRIRFHDLRHTAATLLLLKGIHPKVVSEMLGHATVAITLDLYSHVLPDMQKEATAAMEQVFGK